MRVGIVILCFFAAVWAVAGIVVDKAPTPLVAVPIVISASVLIFLYRTEVTSVERAPHVGRLVGTWSGVEGIAMFLAANLLIKTHHNRALMPVFAIIVGLHFLPLARGIPARFYYVTGNAMIMVGLIGLIIMPSHLPLLTGLAAATIMWISAITVLRRASV